MSPRAYTRRYLVTLVTLLMLVATVNTADKELLAPVADAVRAELGMSDTQLGAVRSSVFLAALLGQFLWGPLSDRWVRKYVNVTLFSVVPPETKATSISASNIFLNLVIAVLSLAIGIGSDLRGLRWSFGGAVLLMFSLGIVVCLALLRTVRRDMAAQQALVRARTG